MKTHRVPDDAGVVVFHKDGRLEMHLPAETDEFEDDAKITSDSAIAKTVAAALLGMDDYEKHEWWSLPIEAPPSRASLGAEGKEQ